MRHQSGQVLLIAVMLLATALTVVLAVSFRSTTDTQTTKLEEEAQKALAGAEAGIDAALKSGGSVDLSDLNVSTGFTGSASVDTTQKPTFVTPLLQKDDQYTLYLADYPKVYSDPSNSNPITADLTFYFGGTGSTSCDGRNTPALELTLVANDASNTVTKKLVEPCAGTKSVGTSSLGTIKGDATTNTTLENINFAYKTTTTLSVSNSKVLFVRPLFDATQVGIDTGGVDLPVQGKTVISEAKSPSGVTKKVQLFQSLPQIPAEFFVTSF